MIGRIREWFTPPPETRGYVDQLLSAQIAAASGSGSVRDSAVYRACLNLLGDAASTATLEGEHAEILQARLGDIVRQMVDVGQASYEITIGRSGQLELLPVEITNVTGQEEEATWFYTVARAGPMATMTAVREQAGVLNCRLRPSPRTPWRGQPSLPSGNSTAALLRKLEVQLTSEAAMKPARILGAGLSPEQREQVSDGIEAAGIVVFPLGKASSDTRPIHAGSVGGEYSTAGVELHGKLGEQVCSVLGVPSDLIVGSGSSVSARESYRRLSSATISPLLGVVMHEWQVKVGPIKFNLDALRASDEVSRARAVGSKANAVSRLVDSGLPLDQAMAVVGIE